MPIFHPTRNIVGQSTIEMDAMLALGHFCEIHGPCVILCTQRSNQQSPLQSPHSLTVPWCAACQSIALDQAFISSSGTNECFITTRTPLKQDLAFLLKQAAVRSLSCEYEQNDPSGGTIYFGDNERGHTISHTFRVHDSLARGFCRKYALLILMRDKIHLLNSWPFIVSYFKRIARDLQDDAKRVNSSEQKEKSQRSLRQHERNIHHRSLSQLTSQPAVCAHLHLWFSWLLGCPVAVEAPPNSANQCVWPPTMRPYSLLRILRQDMGFNLFAQVCYCTIIGIPTFVESARMLDTFRTCLLPNGAAWPTDPALANITGTCIVYQTETGWTVRCPVSLPNKLPSLQLAVDRALHDEGGVPEQPLGLMVSALVLKWLNTAKTLVRCGGERINAELLQSMEVREWDMGMLKYWCMCVDVGTRGATMSVAEYSDRKKLCDKLQYLLKK